MKQTKATRPITRAVVVGTILGLLTAGCGGPDAGPDAGLDAGPGPAADPAETARGAVAQAEATYKASQDVGHAWRQPRVLIESARAALEAGDYEQALRSAERASAMAERSLIQAENEKTAWRERAPFAS